MNHTPNTLHRAAFSVLTTALISVFSATASAQTAQPLTLKRVSLSSSGVGYFEYEAQVSGNAVLTLPVALDKVDDVLKSLVVYDAAGSIGGISLPGQDPIAQTLKQLPFDAAALNKPAALLEALRGAQITVGAPANLRGRIVSVQSAPSNSSKNLVTLSTENGLQQFVLEDVQSLQFEDPALRDQIAKALAALSTNRAKDARTVEILSQGATARMVRVGYVTSVPIWKNAYRITLPSNALTSDNKDAAKAQVQGWAVIENMSGQDWSQVALTLTSGKPVAFSQAIYRSYYNTRPQVGIELPGNIVPQTDAGTSRAGFNAQVEMQPSPAAPRAAFAPAPAAASAAPMGKRANFASDQMAAPATVLTAPAPQWAQAADAASVQDSTTQVSYTFGLPVSVGSGRSLSIPIVQAELPASRVALYQPQLNAQHPLAAVELTNASSNGLLAGAATLYEATGNGSDFVGDAQITALPAQDKRYVPYALDQKLTLSQSSSTLHAVKRYSVVGNALTTEQVRTQTHTFTVKSNHEQARDVVVEVPQYGAPWKLVPAANDYSVVGTAQGKYRVNISAAPLQARSVPVAQQYEETRQDKLMSMSVPQLRQLLTQPAFDVASKPALQAGIALIEKRDGLYEQLRNAEQRMAQALETQAKLRENLKSVPVNSNPHKRYMAELDKADAQEAALKVELKALTTQVQAADKAVE